MIEDLFSIQKRILSHITFEFKRFLYDEINWNNRLIAIIGPRGTGKTTMVLQYYLEKYNDLTKCLYISADNPLVLKEGIYKTVDNYFKQYGECIIIDEVHKQNNWSLEIKALYDAYPDKQIIILGSSALNILGQKGDLSRRLMVYKLPYLSFREYLNFKFKKNLKIYSFLNITTIHLDICQKINIQISHILNEFSNFISWGSYPFFSQYSQDEYYILLNNILDKIIYEDIPSISSIKSTSSMKIKKLLGFIALSTIPLFNVESLTKEIEVSKDTLYEYFDLLHRAEILSIIRIKSKNVRAIKNSKILFKTPNLYYAIASEMWKYNIDKGNIRESFFIGSMSEKIKIYTSKQIDFQVWDDQSNYYEIEIGGKNKGQKQIKKIDNPYIFKDNIEFGQGNSIPLYLAGFLY